MLCGRPPPPSRLKYPGVHPGTAANHAARFTTSAVHASSALFSTSITGLSVPPTTRCAWAMIAAICFDVALSGNVKFAVKPSCERPGRKNMLGNPLDAIPCSVPQPSSIHLSSMSLPFAPVMRHVPREAGLPVPAAKVTTYPVLRTSTSTGYSIPLATTPFADSASTPFPSVSTRVTFGRLNAGRYSSWNVGRLHQTGYHALSFAAVSGSFTISSTRARTRSARGKSKLCSFAICSGIFSGVTIPGAPMIPQYAGIWHHASDTRSGPSSGSLINIAL
ncbi:unnamed protein product [Mycena citricolor]|uniref:Uncharacterized protein n=1 Tax=Mycena citricolor TaxID=2018698 RepID=A0AAD2H7I1_9AGAR|nr:unnamed protein product [Mycena citricolor]